MVSMEIYKLFLMSRVIWTHPGLLDDLCKSTACSAQQNNDGNTSLGSVESTIWKSIPDKLYS